MSGWEDSAAVEDAWATPSSPGGDFNPGPPPCAGFDAGSPPKGDNRSGGFRSFGDDDAAAGAGGAAEGDNTCRYCKLEGHIVRDCPTKPATDGSCFNCGEQGHSKVDCTNPKKFTGTCRICSKEGHAGRDCPKRGPLMCRNCLGDGHTAVECTKPRMPSYLAHIKERDLEEAWDLMKQANDDDDFDEFKMHMLEYIKASPNLTLDELESAFRTQEFRYYLYALTMDVTYDKCLVGIHGQKDAKYLWSLNKSARPRRSKAIAHRLAATPEENLERLKYAGTLEDEVGPFCHQCKEKGHWRTACAAEVPEDAMTKKQVILQCTNCLGLDHRLRDCPLPRKNWDACRNCGQEGHRSTECENPRVASADTECRSCGGKGHFSKECPTRAPQECFNCGQEGHRNTDCTNEKVIKCRNCDERGHHAKECPKPKDVTRIKCNNCNEMGHFSRNCTNPPAPEPEPEAEEVVYGAPKTSSSSVEPVPVAAWDSAKPAAPAASWDSTEPAAPAAAGWGAEEATSSVW